jgi:hypothetical protein
MAAYGCNLRVAAVIYGFYQVGKLPCSVCLISMFVGVQDVPESDGGVVC